MAGSGSRSRTTVWVARILDADPACGGLPTGSRPPAERSRWRAFPGTGHASLPRSRSAARLRSAQAASVDLGPGVRRPDELVAAVHGLDWPQVEVALVVDGEGEGKDRPLLGPGEGETIAVEGIGAGAFCVGLPGLAMGQRPRPVVERHREHPRERGEMLGRLVLRLVGNHVLL